MTNPEAVKRQKLTASAVRVVIAANPMPDASPDDLDAYRGHLESIGIEAVLRAEPRWTKRRGTKRSFLFRVAYNKATTAAKRYLRTLVRGDELDEDRTGGDEPTALDAYELRLASTDAQAWRLAWARRLCELARLKPSYTLALAAYQEKAATGYGFVARVSERLGIDTAEIERALDAFKKRLLRDEIMAELRATAPARGLLAALDDAQELQQHAAEAAEDDDHDQDAERPDPGSPEAGPGLADGAGDSDAAGGVACPEAGEGSASGSPAPAPRCHGRGILRLTQLSVFTPAGPRPAGCSSARSASGSRATGTKVSTSCRRQGRRPSPASRIAEAGAGDGHFFERCGPARAAPLAPS